MSALLALATAATALDAAAYALLIAPGYAAEANPIVASLTVSAALWARGALVVLLAALTLLSAQLQVRRLRLAVGSALVTATVVGMAGFASTVGAVR